MRPDHFGERADELGGGVYTQAQGFRVDDLADGEPEGCFLALWGLC